MTRMREPDDWFEQVPDVGDLFPSGTRRLSRRPGRAPCLLVLPSRGSPRLLVPSEVGASGQMLYRHNNGRLQRLAQNLLALGLLSRVLPLLPLSRLLPVDGSGGEPTIEEHVRENVPGAAHVGVSLGPPRANGKPVLRVFDEAGRTLAFGKVGRPGLSARLVRAEAEVLSELDRYTFSHLMIPSVIAVGRWHGLEVLYLTPMQAAAERESDWELPLAAMHELAEAGGTTSGQLAGSAYAGDLAARVGLVEQEGELTDAFTKVLHRVGGVELGYGRWHGDWAPWNTGSSASGRLRVWDWERSAPDVPLGFDVVHFLLQREFSDGSTAQRALAALLPAARLGLAGWCGSEDQVRATVLLYLVHILTRYVGDAGTAPTDRLRHRVKTVFAMIELLLAAPSEVSRVPG